MMASMESERILAGLGVDPIVVPGGAANFGATLGGSPSVADLKDLIASGTYRVKQLGQKYADFAPTWVQKDSAAFVDWTNDWTKFQNRWNPALKTAQDKASGMLSSLTPDTYMPAADEYTGMMKALKQGYPPDGAQIQKGDFDDLSNRLEAAAGSKINYSAMPQPVGEDAGMGFYKSTANVDVVSMALGDQKPKGLAGAIADGPFGALIRAFRWFGQHPTATQWIIVVVVGGVAIAYVIPFVMAPIKAIKSVTAVAGAAA